MAENAVRRIFLEEAAVRRLRFAGQVEMHRSVVRYEVDAPKHARGGVVEFSCVDVRDGEIVESGRRWARLFGLESGFNDGENGLGIFVHPRQDYGVSNAD